MKRLAIAALMAASCPLALAQDLPKGFVLLNDPDYVTPVGLAGVQTMAMKMSSENLVLNMGEAKLPGSMASSRSEEVRGKQIARDKFRYVLAKSEEKTVVTIAGRENVPPPDEEPLLNVPVILTEVKKGTWTAALEEGEPTEAQKEKLKELEEDWSGNSDVEMYGARPRRIGETWEVDAGALEEFRGSADAVEGKFKLTLKGEENVNGQRCAVIEGTLDALMVMKGKADDDPDTKINMKGTVRILRSLEHFEDTALELKGEMKMGFDVPGPDGPIKMEGSGPFLFTGTLELK